MREGTPKGWLFLRNQLVPNPLKLLLNILRHHINKFKIWIPIILQSKILKYRLHSRLHFPKKATFILGVWVSTVTSVLEMKAREFNQRLSPSTSNQKRRDSQSWESSIRVVRRWRNCSLCIVLWGQPLPPVVLRVKMAAPINSSHLWTKMGIWDWTNFTPQWIASEEKPITRTRLQLVRRTSRRQVVPSKDHRVNQRSCLWYLVTSSNSCSSKPCLPKTSLIHKCSWFQLIEYASQRLLVLTSTHWL